MKRYMEEMDGLLAEYDLTDSKDYIYRNLKKSIRLELTKKDDYRVPGASRVGGYPDVEPEFSWPSTKDGMAMTFIAQLNLREISPCDENELLPKTGMLYFFMGIDEPAYDIEHRIIYSEEEQNLALMKPAEPTVLEEDCEDEFLPYKIVGISCLEIPNYAYMDYDVIEDTDSYIALQEEIANKNRSYVGRVYGYPEGQHDDAELEAALKIIANEKYGYTSKDKDKLVAFLGGDEQKADAEINDIVMLLEIDSNQKVGFQWWDCGVIHFFIRKEDLANRRFDRTYLSLYSS